MNARNVLVQTQRAYSFYSVESQTQSVELIRYIDATAFVSGTLEVRLQAGDPSGWPSNTNVGVELENVSPAPDDPASLYTDNTTRASVVFDNAAAVPELKVASFTPAPFAGYLRCLLTGERPAAC